MVLVSAISPVATRSEDVVNSHYVEQVKFLMNRPEVQHLLKPFESLKSDNARERTQIWRIKFASVNTYQLNKSVSNIKGEMAYYNQRVDTIMPKSVDWNFDYRNAMNKNGKVTVIYGAYDFIDFKGEYYRKLISNYPQINFRLIDRAGHNIWTDEPTMFEKQLHVALSR